MTGDISLIDETRAAAEWILSSNIECDALKTRINKLFSGVSEHGFN
jgi:hypothetical protein